MGEKNKGEKKELVIKNAQVENWRNVEKLLTKENIKQYLCPKASDTDLFLFLAFSKSRKLNPFKREVYLIKYSDTAPASIVTAKETYFKRADSFPQNDGMKSGIIVRKGTVRTYREGYSKFEGETLLGGWAEQYRKDRRIPVRVEVSLEEYTGKKYNWQSKTYETNKMWKSKPATMITKVAEIHALRKAFPNEFSGMYIPEEMELGNQALPEKVIDMKSIKEPKEEVIDVSPAEKVEKPEKSKFKGKEGKLEDKPTAEKPKEEPKVKSGMTDKQAEELYALMGMLPENDLEKRAEFIKILQEKVGIPAERVPKDYTSKEARAMIDLLKKQVDIPVEPPAEEPPEEKEEKKPEPEKKKPAEKKGNTCCYKKEDGEVCGRFVSKKVAEYSKKEYGKIYCFNHQPNNMKKEE